jgi:8-oxo-dGTP diphosphatase
MKSFNLRVYGLLINDKNEILVSDERRNGVSFTKFPGGGLEFGEGLAEGLKREFQEEIGIDIEVEELFYVNDFLQVSAFNENHQLISFYYFVHFNETSILGNEIYTIPFPEDGEKQRWISISELDFGLFTFPIDQLVAEKLKNAR